MKNNPPQPELQRVNLAMSTGLAQQIDDWRRRQPKLPSMSEAIRRLIEMGLESDKPPRKR
jgi:hypothetical protein